MAGYPLPERGNKTCLQLAYKPYIDSLARKSILGRAQTVPAGYPAGSDVANLSVMGYDPARYYTGRSPLEAASIGIPLKDTDVTLRCNLVTLSEQERYEEKTMLDYSSGEIYRGSARTHLLFEKRVRQTALYALCGHFVSTLPGNRPRQNGGNVYPSARYFR